MRPNFFAVRLSGAVFAFACVFIFSAGSVAGQCTPPGPPSFSAATETTYHYITLTVGGVATSAVLEQLSNGQWYTLGAIFQDGTFGVGGLAHNQTVTFRARNYDSCFSEYVYASATTLDVGWPWLYVYTGFQAGVMVDSGPVPPDLNTAVIFSSNGVDFNTLGIWTQNAQVFVTVAPNITHYFYAKTYVGTEERRTPIKMVRLAADQDYGNPSCRSSSTGTAPPAAPSSVGKPVNVTNGNMFLSQTDYRLPGLGEAIDITRSYNSLVQSAGMFGFGWSSAYDEYLTLTDSRNIRFAMDDGRAVYFARAATDVPFTGITPGFPGSITVNGDGTYTLAYKDGRTKAFGPTGKLIWLKDRNGNQTTLNYNTSGIVITDGFGRTLNIVSNTNGTVSKIYDSLTSINTPFATYEYELNTTKLKTVTYNDGSQYRFTYDTTAAPGKILLATVRDALDNIVETHLYDAQGRATTSEVHGGKEKYTLDYTNAGLTTNAHTIVTDGLTPGRVTKYYYDRSGVRNVVKKVEGLCGYGGGGSESTEYFYDDQLNLVKKTDALLRDTVYTYDVKQNLTSITDVYGTQKFTYNAFGEVLTYRDRIDSQSQNPIVYTRVNTYNSAGNLLTTKDALNYVTTIEYPTTNNKGLPDSIKDARNNITKFKWFAASGLLDEIEDPYTKKTKFTYDARGRTQSMTNALGHVTSYAYVDSYIDIEDNQPHSKVEMTYPNLDKITYRYDKRRLLDKVTDEREKITRYEFDPQYRLQKITDPLGHSKQFGYDDMSNLRFYTDPLGNITEYKYDDFDRVKEIDYPALTTGAPRPFEKFAYDKLGRISKHTDTANRDTDYAYNDQTRTSTVTNAELEVTTTKYNQRLKAIEVKDALNQVYQFSYDPLGRVLSQTRAGGTMSFEYDEVGNRKKRVDYRGRETKYTYDNLNRLNEIEYLLTGEYSAGPTPTQKSTYGYDDISRLTSAANETGTVTFGYDNRNRMTSTTDVFGRVLGYEYERTATVDQRRLKIDGALYATYNFDAAERLQNIVNATDGATIGFTYFDDNSVQTRTYPNGVSTNYLYDNMGRLTRLTDAGPAGTLFDRQYGYNGANQIETITEPANTRTFGYDLVDRLRTVTASNNQNENYLFDDVGNRTSSHRSSTYGYQPFNKIASTQTATYGSDANGNMVSKSEGKEFWRYTWDHENRMTEASTRKQKVRYKFDALGRRVERNLGFGKERTKFTYDGNDVLVDDNFGTLTKYLNGPGIDNKLRSTTGSNVSYFLSDHLGSTNELTNAAGGLTASNSYDSFGNATNTAFPSRYQFTGREFDNFTGLQFSRARFYDPNLGRFISEDPIGFGGGDINLYGYVQNNPNGSTDPSGLFPFSNYGDPLTFWSRGADTFDGYFNTAHDFYGVDPVIGWNPVFGWMTVFGMLHGGADMFRAGTGLGQALYCEDNAYGKAAFIAMDIQRATGLFATMAGPFAGRFGGPPKNPPNPFGKLGGAEHQAMVGQVADDIAARGLTPQTEYLIRTPNGAKTKRFADVASLDAGGNPVEFHQVGRQTSGGLPVSRERQAINDIRNATGINPRFHPF